VDVPLGIADRGCVRCRTGVGRWVSKPPDATIAVLLGAAFNIAPYALRLLHVLPEACTGCRPEGVFFAGSFFVEKSMSGVGIFLAGAILEIAGFPEKAIAGQVPVAPIGRLVSLADHCRTGGALLQPVSPRPAAHDARLAHLRAELAE
jgi:hypothetical protein